MRHWQATAEYIDIAVDGDYCRDASWIEVSVQGGQLFGGLDEGSAVGDVTTEVVNGGSIKKSSKMIYPRHSFDHNR